MKTRDTALVSLLLGLAIAFLIIPDDMFTNLLQAVSPESRCPLGYGDSVGSAAFAGDNPHANGKEPSLPQPKNPKSGEHKASKKVTIYHNCKVYTGDLNQSPAEAFAVEENKFIAVGSLNHVRSAIPNPNEATEVDLDGSFVTPGLIDAHLHLISGGLSLNRLNLRLVADKLHFIDAVHAAIQEASPGEWIQGANWDESKWGGEAPSAAWIDRVSPENPIFLTRMDAHQAVVNTLAMTLANLSSHTPDPPGGVITRDPVTKEPTGLLSDAAMLLVSAAIPAKTVEQRQTGLFTAQDHLLSWGITSVHDMGRIAFLEGDDAAWEDFEEVYLPAANNNELKIRINAFVPLPTWRRMAERVKHVGRTHPGGKLMWGGVKEFYDGSLGSRTALMHEPYNDSEKKDDVDATGGGGAGAGGGGTLDKEEAEELLVGTRTVDKQEFQEQIQGAHAAGLQIAVHAIGDCAVDEVLDAFENILQTEQNQAKKENESSGGGGDTNLTRLRHRIEHAQHTKNSAAVVSKMSKLGIVTTPNPLHLLADAGILESRIGKERVDHGAYAFKTLCSFQNNAVVSLSSSFSLKGEEKDMSSLDSNKENDDNCVGGRGGGSNSSNTVCAFASDWPVVPLNPALTIRAATLQSREKESVSPEEALVALTSSAAYIGHKETELGRIAPGLLADFVVFNSDILDSTLSYVEVRQTFVDGVCVYERSTRKGCFAAGGGGGDGDSKGGGGGGVLRDEL